MRCPSDSFKCLLPEELCGVVIAAALAGEVEPHSDRRGDLDAPDVAGLESTKLACIGPHVNIRAGSIVRPFQAEEVDHVRPSQRAVAAPMS